MVSLRCIALACLLSAGPGCQLIFESSEEPSEEPRSEDFFISPVGDDGADGKTEATAFKTWEHAFSQLEQGMTLIVLDGVYDDSNSGYPDIDCEGAEHSAGVTVAARNQRQAYLQTAEYHAGPALRVNCRNWTIEGLRISGTIQETTLDHDTVIVTQPGVILRDLYLHGNASNGSLLKIEADQVLVEGLEAYLFKANAIRVRKSNGLEIRTSYFNGNSIIDTTAVHLDASSANIDNLIIENVDDGVYIENGSRDVTISGSVVRNSTDAAFHLQSLCSTECLPIAITERVRIHNSVATGCQAGVDVQSVVDASIDHFSSFNSEIGLDFAIGHANNSQITNKSITITDSLLSGDETGIELVATPGPITLDQVNIFNAGQILVVDGTKEVLETFDGISATNITKTDPETALCQVYLHADSPMHDLADGLGANIVYRSINGGEPTSELLWGDDGSFPCGASVPDVSTSNCSNVHNRIAAGSLECPRPPG